MENGSNQDDGDDGNGDVNPRCSTIPVYGVLKKSQGMAYVCTSWSGVKIRFP